MVVQVGSSLRGTLFSVFFLSVTGDQNCLRVVLSEGAVYQRYFPHVPSYRLGIVSRLRIRLLAGSRLLPLTPT